MIVLLFKNYFTLTADKFVFLGCNASSACFNVRIRLFSTSPVTVITPPLTVALIPGKSLVASFTAAVNESSGDNAKVGAGGAELPRYYP